MQNYIQNGHVITVAAPTGGTTSGEGLIVGNIFGHAVTSGGVVAILLNLLMPAERVSVLAEEMKVH